MEGREGSEEHESLWLCWGKRQREEGKRENSENQMYLKGKVCRVVVRRHVVAKRLEVREKRFAGAVVRHISARGQEKDVGEMAPHPRGRGVDDAHDHTPGPTVLAHGKGVQQAGH